MEAWTRALVSRPPSLHPPPHSLINSGIWQSPAQLSSCMSVCFGDDADRGWGVLALQPWMGISHTSQPSGSASCVPCLPLLHGVSSPRNHLSRGCWLRLGPGQALMDGEPAPCSLGALWPEIYAGWLGSSLQKGDFTATKGPYEQLSIKRRGDPKTSPL